MKIGADKNKLILLAVLSAVAIVSVYTQFFAAAPATARAPRPAARARTPAAQRNASASRRAQPAANMRGQSFRPRFNRRGEDDPLDPMSVDPTLRTDLLARVRAVTFEGVQRNLFRFGERKKTVKPPSRAEIDEAQARLKSAAKPAPPPKSPAKVSPPARRAPPLKWKYYGFANAPEDARKRAFLLDGEEVMIATEGDIFKKRYRIVRIGVNSIVIKDMDYDEEQSLPLEES